MFHPRLIGLTGSARRHPQGRRRLQGLLRQGRSRQGCADYTVDHTAFIYLMDRDGNYLGFFPPGTSAERMVEIIRPQLGVRRARLIRSS